MLFFVGLAGEDTTHCGFDAPTRLVPQTGHCVGKKAKLPVCLMAGGFAV
jgi:hypothetical protein